MSGGADVADECGCGDAGNGNGKEPQKRKTFQQDKLDQKKEEEENGGRAIMEGHDTQKGTNECL